MGASRPFTVATFNIRYANPRDNWHRWELRRRAALRLIRSWQATILGLQEVLPSQRDYLVRHLRGVQWYGVGRNDGDLDGEQSPIALSETRLTDIELSTRWLSAEPERVGSIGWDARIPRIATIVRATLDGRHDIGIVNTHFDHKGTVARSEAAAQIAAMVTAETTRAWIVMGDLNATPDSSPVRFLHDAGLVSAIPPDSGGTAHAWSGGRDGRQIDHILLTKQFSVQHAGIDYRRPFGVLPSDHWPLTATLTHH